MRPSLHATILFALAACDAAPSTRDASAPDAVAADDVPPCSMRPDGSNAACVLRVRGRAVDTAGAPLANAVVTYCGAVCFATSATAAGDFTLDVGDFIDASAYALLVHGRPDHASLHVRSPAPVDGVVTFEPVAVPRYADVGPALPEGVSAGGAFTAGDVTLTVAPGTTLEFDLEDALLGELGHRLRAAYVPTEQHPRFARDAGLSAVWALAPFNLVADRPLAVRVANRAGLAPGAAVEFVTVGQDYLRAPPTAGQTIVAATGRVSPDGAFITTAPGAGLSFLTWLGVRPRR